MLILLLAAVFLAGFFGPIAISNIIQLWERRKNRRANGTGS
jgi:hypothetical protein